MSRSLAGLRPSTSMCRAPEAERNTGLAARTGPKKLRSMALNWTYKANLVRFRDLNLARFFREGTITRGTGEWRARPTVIEPMPRWAAGQWSWWSRLLLAGSRGRQPGRGHGVVVVGVLPDSVSDQGVVGQRAKPGR